MRNLNWKNDYITNFPIPDLVQTAFEYPGIRLSLLSNYIMKIPISEKMVINVDRDYILS